MLPGAVLAKNRLSRTTGKLLLWMRGAIILPSSAEDAAIAGRRTVPGNLCGVPRWGGFGGFMALRDSWIEKREASGASANGNRNMSQMHLARQGVLTEE